MKYLNKFYSYLKESNSINMSEIEYLTYSLKDNNIKVSFYENQLIVNGNLRKAFNINISLNNLKTFEIAQEDDPSEKNVYSDYMIWEIMEEILLIKSRVKSNNIDIGLKLNSNYFTIYIISEVVNNLLQEYYIQLNNRLGNPKSSFDKITNSTTRISAFVDKDPKIIDHVIIKIKANEYLQRQFDNFINNIVDLDKVIISKYVDEHYIINEIRLK